MIGAIIAAFATAGGAEAPAASPGCGNPNPLPERDPTVSAASQGLFRKFEVRRTDGSDGPGGKHEGCEYFVLDVTHDVHAKAALTAYAAACRSTHPALADDLWSRHDLGDAAGPLAQAPAQPAGPRLEPGHRACECRNWVVLTGVPRRGEYHHRDCKRWHERVEAYITKTEVIVLGDPEEGDEAHDCDAMGCSSVSHVMHRFPLAGTAVGGGS